jgi:hypothetical protein
VEEAYAAAFSFETLNTISELPGLLKKGWR